MQWQTHLFDVLVFSAAASAVVLATGAVAAWFSRRPAQRVTVILWTLTASLAAPIAGFIPGYPHLSQPPTSSPAVAEKTSFPSPAIAPAPFEQPVVERSKKAAAPLARSATISRPSFRLDWRRSVVVAWLAGLAISCGWWLAGVVNLWRLLRAAAPAPPEAAQVLSEIAGAAGPRVRLLTSRRIAQPIACWWGRPVIVLPAGACEDGEQLHWRLAHEWAHLQNGDAIAWLFASATRSLLYFQPLCWLLCRQLRFDQDVLADAQAARSGKSAEDYADFLLAHARAAHSPSIPALGMAAPKSQLFRRVVMLLNHRERLERKVSWPFRLAIAALILLAAALAGALPAPKIYPGRARSSSASAQEAPAEAIKPAAVNPDRGRLRYAGKNFAVWRDTLKDDLEPATRVKAIKALESFGANGYSEEVARLFSEVLGHKATGESVHRAAIKAAPSLGPKGIEVVRAAIGSDNSTIRNTAAGVLGSPKFDVAEALPLLLDVLGDQEYAVRYNACQSIGKFKESASSARSKLIEVARNDDNAQVRAAACDAIGRLGTPDEAATEALLAAMEDSSSSVGLAAAAALAHSGVNSAEVQEALVDAIVAPGEFGMRVVMGFENDRRNSEFVAQLLADALGKLDLGSWERAEQILRLFSRFAAPPKSAEPALRRWLAPRGRFGGLEVAEVLVKLKPMEAETIAAIREASNKNDQIRLHDPTAERRWRIVLKSLEE